MPAAHKRHAQSGSAAGFRSQSRMQHAAENTAGVPEWACWLCGRQLRVGGSDMVWLSTQRERSSVAVA